MSNLALFNIGRRQCIFKSCLQNFFSGCRGASDCCTVGEKCNEGEGDCDGDDECMPGLRCGKHNCRIKSGYDWGSDDDCCFRPGKYVITRRLTEISKNLLLFNY